MDKFNDKYIIIDTETSSLKIDEGEVLQLSAIKVDSATGEIIDIYDKYLKPTERCEFNPFSMKVNGISRATLEKAYDRKLGFKEFNEFCSDVNVIMGYNVHFDINMIDDDIEKEGLHIFDGRNVEIIDILNEVVSANLNTTDNKLSTIASYFGYETNFHNSFYDVLATNHVYRKLNELPIMPDSEIVVEYIKAHSLEYNPSMTYFRKKNVCVSGEFSRCTRDDIERIIVDLGGVLKTGMSMRVDIFIDGWNDHITGKEKKYKEIVDSGKKQIELLCEDSFMEILQKGLKEQSNEPSLFDLFEEEKSNISSKPFVGKQIAVLGKLSWYKNPKKYLADLGAKISDPSKNVAMVFVFDEPNEKMLNKITDLKFSGFELNILGESDFKNIIEQKYDGYTDYDVPKKDLKMTFNHYERFHMPMEYVVNTDGLLISNPIANKDIYICNSIDGDKSLISSMIGILGAFGDFGSLSENIKTVILDDKTIVKLKNGEKDNDIKYLEESYNKADSVNVLYKFIAFSELINYIEKRIETLNDDVLRRVYDSYKKS